MPSFSSFIACIKVGGRELPEYDIQVDEAERKVTCWIPSEVGKHFSVCWYTEGVMPIDTCGWVTLDGVTVGGRFGRSGWQVKQDYAFQYTSATSGRYFSFAPITYTDDDAYLGVGANIGEIQLQIGQVTLGPLIPYSYETVNPDTTLHERSKKLGSHRVQFGKEQPTAPATFTSATCLQFLATFHFRYRPLDLLQANGIVPAHRLAEVDSPLHENTSGTSRVRPFDRATEVRMNKPKEESPMLGLGCARKRKASAEVEDPTKKAKTKTKKANTLFTKEIIDLT